MDRVMKRTKQRGPGGARMPWWWMPFPSTFVMLLVASMLGSAAQAEAPGSNGQITFSRSFSSTDEDFGVFVVDPDGSDVRPATSLHLECPHWSPDGHVIVTCGGPRDAIAVMFFVDSGRTRYISSPDPTLFITCPIMSPDGSRLLCDQYDQPADPTRNGIYSIASSGRGLLRVTSNPGGHDFPGGYSPDGTRIVFDRFDPNRPPSTNNALFIVNLDGTGLTRITPWGFPGDEAGGRWSPDGTEILFGRGGSIYTVRPDGTGSTRVPLAIAGSWFASDDPVWSPDGTRIAFALFGAAAHGAPTEGIFTANRDGTDVVQVTAAPIYDAHPDWGPHPQVPNSL